MELPKPGNLISLRLGTKSILAVILLLTTISAALTTFFVNRYQTQLTAELRKRAFSLASNMAYNNQFAMLSGDLRSMMISISGVTQESDIQEAYIVDLKGVVTAHRDSSLIGSRVAFSARLDNAEELQWLPGDSEDIRRTVALIDIERRLVDSSEEMLFGSSDPTPPGSVREHLGYVVLEVSLANMRQAVAEGTRRAVLITLIVILAGSVATVLMIRRVALPLYRLADATKAVAMGDLEQEVHVPRRDEIGQLAGSFNHMTRQLRVSRAKIEAWNRELEAKVADRTRELKEKHEELEIAYESLKTLDKAKDDFLSLVSHELRTPLSSVLLYSEMLLDGMDDSKETRQEFLSIIVHNCRRLTRLINDVLDLSKIEAGRMPFKPVELDAADLVRETVSGLKPTIDAKNLSFDAGGVDSGVKLWGDRDRVVQVLTNVISNAVKFTPEGGKIAVELEKNRNHGVISVRDTGKGISKADIPKVFDRFSHLESIEHHSEGSGLGMTISKSIIEKLDGEIWIESEVGVGTTVFFSLPRAGRHLESDEDKEKEKSDGLRQEQDSDS